MDNFSTVLENLNGLKDLEQTNPDYYRFIHKYFTDQGGTAEEMKDVKDINELGMKMINHYVGNALSSLNILSYYFQKDHDEDFLDKARNKATLVSAFILSVPEDVWIYLIKKHGLDNSWNDLGERLREFSNKISKNLAENNASELAENIDKLFDLYRDATDKNAL